MKSKIKSFLKTKAGKSLLSVGIGALNATPLAPFVPSIPEFSKGTTEKGEPDYIAYATSIIVTILAVLAVFGYISTDKVELFKELTE